MCGIAGVWDFTKRMAAEQLEAATRGMSDRIAYRGPDDMGLWQEKSAGVAFAHRRLSIVDLSPAGHQPMHSASGRFTITYNGEIYNHAELRAKLEAEGVTRWRGHSDSEVFLEAIERWGMVRALQATVGMFAFAVWDHRERTMTLARDRMGEKPLYYGIGGGVFLFGSELKALSGFPGFDNGVDRTALALLLWHNVIPAPWSIYSGVAKLPAGTYLTFSEGDLRARLPTPTPYWSLREKVLSASPHPASMTEDQACDAFETLLSDAIGLQSLADVPVGAFLSGGIDSSLVVALMQRNASQRVRTFSIGFNEDEFNESDQAAAVARHLGTDHTALTVTAKDALDVVPRLPQIYDEPFADSSQIPTTLVAALARKSVTVCLSGDAADELFGGYNRYIFAPGLWQLRNRIPAPLRGMAAGTARFAAGLGDSALAPFAALARSRGLAGGQMRDRLQKISLILGAQDDVEAHAALAAYWPDPLQVVPQVDTLPDVYAEAARGIIFPDLVSRMMYIDSAVGLPDDILVKVDRAAMAVNLETRVPFLDHRLVEWSLGLPRHLQTRGKRGKWLVRRTLARHLPESLIERPKMGFGIPLGAWLRGELRDWAEDLLSERKLTAHGLLRPEPIRRKWAEHLAGKHNWQLPIWNVLMFQAWMDVQQRR
jgi:asparagine synthase (glutamine-hydrolysing)